MNLAAGLTSLDPAYASNESNVWMTSQIFNGLVELDSQLKISPSVAYKWDIEENGKLYRFYLKKNVFFHNDSLIFKNQKTRNVVASDFVYSFTRICDPKTASPGLWIFKSYIEGIDEFRNGKTNTVSGFKAINDTTLELKLVKPFPPFLSLLTMPYAFVLPHEAFENSKISFSKKPIGTGAFLFSRWREGKQLVLLKNNQYFEYGLPKLDAIEVRFISSKLTAYSEFLRGNIDFIDGLDISFKDDLIDSNGNIQLKHKGKFQFFTNQQLTTEYIGLMNENKIGNPFSDYRVRKALHHSIDKEKITKFLLTGFGQPAIHGFVPLGMPGQNPNSKYCPDYNLETAKKLLADAGFPNGISLPEISLYTSPSYIQLAEFIQKSAKASGFRIKIVSMEGSSQREKIYAGQAYCWRASWIADYTDAENFLALFYSKNKAPGPNTSRFESKEFDEIYQQALNTSEDSIRYKLYQRLDQLAMKSTPIIPLYYYQSIRLSHNNIINTPNSPMNLYLPLKYVYKKTFNY